MEFTMIETGWLSLIPPILAITLALITKEVYSSLFLALLWAVVILVSKSGGSEAYGRWAGAKLKSRKSAALATSFLGILIFIDDGFNCLTVGTVMRPIMDRMRVSREKLAYIIDSTAAPVCIIAPVSSWAVAVASEVSEEGGFGTFLQTIPYNFYALLTIAMVFLISITGKDFGPMKKAEEAAMKGDSLKGQQASADAEGKGKVIDLVLPILVLIICAILGGYNPTAGLTLGAFAGLITAMLLYLPRKLMTAKEFIGYIVEGIGSIVPPMLILILSWSLGGVCRQLIGTGLFISGFVSTANLPLAFLPVLIFIISALMSFSMGTSWGTFGMLIPIITMICATPGAEVYLIPALGATLAGSVYGDHCSPISDTTILSSTGAECQHISHVETQLPYATLVAVICGIGYLIAGLMRSPWIALAVGLAHLQTAERDF